MNSFEGCRCTDIVISGLRDNRKVLQGLVRHRLCPQGACAPRLELGKHELTRNELVFNVRNQPAFEIPFTEITNTNLAGKNEVAVEFSLPDDGMSTGTEGLGGARAKGKKSGASSDQLTEMRFYIPGTEKKTKKGGDDEEANGEEDVGAASLFYEQLMEKADIGEVAGETFASFLEILHLTPRGRFDVDMYEKSFRLRGKTYDYKISYENAKRFSSSKNPTTCTPCSVSAWILLSVKARLATRSLSCSLRRTRRLASN